MVEYDLAASGISGFETAFQLCYQALVLSGKMELNQLIRLMTVQPAQILNLPAGTLAVGAAADIALVDLDCEQTIRVEDFLSKGKIRPFVVEVGVNCVPSVFVVINRRLFYL